MSAVEKCSQCLNSFSMLKLPRKLPCCQHSICEGCLRDIIDTRQEIIICGFCANQVKKEDIRIFSLNTVLLLSLSQASPEPLKPSQLPPEENQLLGDLVGIEQIEESEQLCPSHKVVMDIICISDKQRICPHCALFGNHRDHRFKRLQDFQKEVGEKRKVFNEIEVQKQQLLTSEHYKIYQQLSKKVELKRLQLLEDIEQEVKRCMESLLKAKQKATEAAQAACKDFQQAFSSLPEIFKFEKSKTKLQKWEKTILQALENIDNSPNVEEKLYSYYEGPLEIVTEGFIFIEELSKHGQEAIRTLNEKLAEIHFSKESGESAWLENIFTLKKGKMTPSTSMIKSGEEESDLNPFMECTSSEVVLAQSSLINNINLEADISTISRQIKGESAKASLSPRKQQLQLKAVKSVEKEKPRNSANIQKFANSPKTHLRRPTSELVTYKLTPRMVKSPTAKEIATTKEIPREIMPEEVKPFETKEPEKIYLQFSKNTLSDFFDLSECNLASDRLVEYVHRARRIHKIKGLKLCNNRLNVAGFERMTEFLQGVSNINLANNNLNEGIFDAILRNKERLEWLRLINLSHNPINLDKKVAGKMEEVKKSGVIIVL